MTIGEEVFASKAKFNYLDQLINVMGKSMEILLLEYKRVGWSGEQPPEYFVIESFKVG